MKNTVLLLCLSALVCCTPATKAPLTWAPVGDKIKTAWAEKVDPANPLPEYPRPIMERTEWQNLNGLWDYAILPVGADSPAVFDGQILVPFAVESSLSGVGKRVGQENELWYSREFSVPKKWKKNRMLLHFGAVDWRCDVWVNDTKVGSHEGGYAPFTFDVTDALKKGDNKLTLRVWDPTDKGYQARGKQVENPHAIWYTPVTGIWQTVWLEPVGEVYIADVKTTPDVDRNMLVVEPLLNAAQGTTVSVKVYDGSVLVAESTGEGGRKIEIAMPADVKLWSPDAPFLYDMQVALSVGGKAVDQVKSYAAMRKFSSAPDAEGIVRLMLNDKPIFHYGPLDQGWWPDGLYTAPTDEALAYDIQKTKDLGFNMIRKHVKVEPARWYTHCDRVGIIVWQDMPNGDKGPQWQMHQYFDGEEIVRSPESEAAYRAEWKEIVDYLYAYPCIGVWVPFNEAWGQFKTCDIAAWTKQHDPSRLVNPASGGNHYKCSDMLDLHNYPGPSMYLYDPERVTVLGEYGGIGLVLKEHLWEPDRNWGYVQFNSPEEVTDEYVKFAKEMKEMISKGFSAAVYTQTTDVEIEVNGLLTYDRKVVKVNEERVRAINRELIGVLK
ncbi:MAG: beta galactosidase jelly roll domain-containing protein [Rikenellaceae bacterium]|jgi:beta-galactosidase/beta-glucuronidase|nr:beta galactosidase jelly roll domain-containing protein [Rikenellaceae bacterium]